MNGRSGGRSQGQGSIDDISKQIIEELQADGRKSYAAIGQVVGLSEAAVRQRVQRLTDSGVIQIVGVTDPMQLGFARQALIGIKLSGDLEAAADALAAMPEVDYVVITAGSFDILAEVVCESDEQLMEILSRQIRSIPGVHSTETFVYLKLHKQSYSWGVR
ncbi:MAG: Lrp/AsnC family transcriptional regulator [Nocardioides sp.]|mgnify:CR=1 FL=1